LKEHKQTIPLIGKKGYISVNEIRNVEELIDIVINIVNDTSIFKSHSSLITLYSTLEFLSENSFLTSSTSESLSCIANKIKDDHKSLVESLIRLKGWMDTVKKELIQETTITNSRFLYLKKSFPWVIWDRQSVRVLEENAKRPQFSISGVVGGYIHKVIVLWVSKSFTGIKPPELHVYIQKEGYSPQPILSIVDANIGLATSYQKEIEEILKGLKGKHYA